VFFALWPDARSRESLHALAMDVATQRGGRAPHGRNLHVTLAFVGDVAACGIPLLERLGKACAGACPAFDLSLDALGGTSQGIAWVAPRNVPAPLESLHASLVAALSAEGFAIERRRFRPHATLARKCTGPVMRRVVGPIAWRVNRLALVASTPGQGSSSYADIASWPLANGAAD
jgi:2'-5' RNA ligase